MQLIVVYLGVIVENTEATKSSKIISNVVLAVSLCVSVHLCPALLCSSRCPSRLPRSPALSQSLPLGGSGGSYFDTFSSHRASADEISHPLQEDEPSPASRSPRATSVRLPLFACSVDRPRVPTLIGWPVSTISDSIDSSALPPWREAPSRTFRRRPPPSTRSTRLRLARSRAPPKLVMRSLVALAQWRFFASANGPRFAGVCPG
jgi:hypothetical protein